MTSSAFFKPASSTRTVNEARGATGRSGQNGRRGEIRWPPMGRSDGHQWGLSMAAYGEILMAAVNNHWSREFFEGLCNSLPRKEEPVLAGFELTPTAPLDETCNSGETGRGLLLRPEAEVVSAEPSVGAGRPPDLCDSYNRRRLIRAGGLTAERLATERGTAALRSRCRTLCLRTAGSSTAATPVELAAAIAQTQASGQSDARDRIATTGSRAERDDSLPASDPGAIAQLLGRVRFRWEDQVPGGLSSKTP